MTAVSARGHLAYRRLAALRPGLPRWLRSVLEWAGITLVGIAVLGLLFVAFAPRIIGWHFVVVAGGSMEPTIQFGSVAVMTNVNPANVKVGDVVMYNDPRSRKVVTHRIVAVSADGQQLTTRGDANNASDEGTLPRSSIRGKYLLSVPEVGHFVHWMGTREGFLGIILAPGLLIIGFELFSIAREVRRSRQEMAGPVKESDAE